MDIEKLVSLVLLDDDASITEEEYGEIVNDASQCGYFPLHTAIHNHCHKALVSLLNFSNIDIELVNTSKSTPLHVAAFSNNIEACKQLIERGANIHATDCWGKNTVASCLLPRQYSNN